MTLRMKINDQLIQLGMGDISHHEAADAVLAAIREHLTSPEAVERATNIKADMTRFGQWTPCDATRAAILAALGEEPAPETKEWPSMRPTPAEQLLDVAFSPLQPGVKQAIQLRRLIGDQLLQALVPRVLDVLKGFHPSLDVYQFARRRHRGTNDGNQDGHAARDHGNYPRVRGIMRHSTAALIEWIQH